jgi:hypothetical protein
MPQIVLPPTAVSRSAPGAVTPPCDIALFACLAR